MTTLEKLNSYATAWSNPERKGPRFGLRSIWGCMIHYKLGGAETINGFQDDQGNWIPNNELPLAI